MRTLFLPLTGLLLSGSLLASAAQADEPRYNQISLQTQVEQAVNHDTMQVTFYAEDQDRDPEVRVLR